MKVRTTTAIFNRGLVSRLAMARVDVERVAVSAEVMSNWIPRVLGAMTFRPGTRWLGNTANNAAAVYMPFEFAFDDTAILEMTPSLMRVWANGDTLVTRPAVSAAISNGDFTSDLAGWTDADETGAVSSWESGSMKLLGTKYLEARRRQSVSITETSTPHALRVSVLRGPVLIRVGTSAGADDVFAQAVLRTGTHSLAFTPGAATIHVEFASALDYPVLVASVAIEGEGVLALPTPWDTEAACQLIRHQQSNDVIFVAADGFQPRRIERRENGSWSITAYEPDDGPFAGASGSNIRLTPSAQSGEITLTASRGLFTEKSVGQLYRLTSQGQRVEASLSSDAVFSDEIRITGVSTGRNISVSRSGTWTATVSLQRSIGEPGSWVTVATFTTAGTTTYNDGLDNTIAFYRIGIESGNHTLGTVNLSLTAEVGTITGVARVTGFTSSTEVDAVVLSALGGTDPTEVWEEGQWAYGYPTAVALYEGRMWWSGRGRIWGSVSDVFDSFDPDFEGDAGPINRFIGEGAVDEINWLLPVQRLLAGSGSAEHSVRSTSFDEPVTPSNINIKDASTQGSAPIPAIKVDGRGVFVQRSRSRVYEMSYEVQRADYAPNDLTALIPDLAAAGFRRLAVQRQPDTRVWGVLDDGRALVLLRDPAEDVLGWFHIETDGKIEDVAVLPGDFEDRVFWSVMRTVNGADVRFHEEMARFDQCEGGAACWMADAGVYYSGAATTTLGGLGHLEGKTVVVWGDGADRGTFTVSSGAVTLPSPVSAAFAGLGYSGPYKTAKSAIQLPDGTILTQRSRINKLGLVLANTHAQGLEFGPDFERMDNLPLVVAGADVSPDSHHETFSDDMIEFPGDWVTDARVCLRATAPRPVTVLAAVASHDVQTA